MYENPGGHAPPAPAADAHGGAGTIFEQRGQKIVKTDFQVLKFKFHACSFKQAFYPLYKLYIAWPWQHKITFIQAFFRHLLLSNVHV